MRILSLLTLAFFVTSSCTNTIESKETSNIKAPDTLDSISTKEITKTSIEKKSKQTSESDLLQLYIFADSSVILKELKNKSDTIGLVHFGDTLKYKGAFGHCYPEPEYGSYNKKGWYKVIMDSDSTGWININNVAIKRKFIKSNKLQIILKSHCGDGFKSWVAGKVSSLDFKIVKDLGKISSYKKGYWVKEDSQFVFLDFHGIKLYDKKNASVRIIESKVKDIVLNSDERELAYVKQDYIPGRPPTFIRRMGVVNLQDFSIDLLQNMDTLKIGLGVNSGELSYYGLKNDIFKNKKCYSFLVSYPYDSGRNAERWYVDYEGNILGKIKP